MYLPTQLYSYCLPKMKNNFLFLSLKKNYASVHCKWRQTLTSFNSAINNKYVNYDKERMASTYLKRPYFMHSCLTNASKYGYFNINCARLMNVDKFQGNCFRTYPSLHIYYHQPIRAFSTFTNPITAIPNISKYDLCNSTNSISHTRLHNHYRHINNFTTIAVGSLSNLPALNLLRPGLVLHSTMCNCSQKADSKSNSIDFVDSTAGMLMGGTKQKIDHAKDRIENVKQNFMDDIQSTKALVKERMENVIERENIITIPNFLCLFRIVAAPFLCHLVVTGSYSFALGLFLLAGATDMVDGWIARMFPSQSSMLGTFLDPLADKVLVAALFLSLTYNGLIPGALTALIIYRDCAIIAGASYLRYKSLPEPRTLLRYFDATHATIQLAPTTISKVNTVVQLALITATLAQPVVGLPCDEHMTLLRCFTTLSTLASGLSYIFSDDTHVMLRKMQPQEHDTSDGAEKQDSAAGPGKLEEAQKKEP